MICKQLQSNSLLYVLEYVIVKQTVNLLHEHFSDNTKVYVSYYRLKCSNDC